jgi:hypothetical protein
MDRNGWPESIGISGRNASEYAPQERGYVEHPFFIETSDGKKMDGLSVAIQAVDDWKKIFSKFSIT